MRCRPYVSTDRDACIQAFHSNSPIYFLPEELDDYVRFLDALPGPYFSVADEDVVIACGGIATGRVTGEADVCWTIVHAQHQRRGVGDLVIASCAAEILSMPDCKTARLDTSQHTRAFFERWGFQATSMTPNGYGPGLDRIEMRIMLDAETRHTWNRMISPRADNR